MLKAVLDGRAHPLPDVLRAEGANAFRREARKQVESFGSLEWWPPFTEGEVNELGYEMLEAERVDEAMAAFEFNAERYPGSANAFDSLAEAHYRRGDLDTATQLYETSLQLDRTNENAARMLEKIRGERNPPGQGAGEPRPAPPPGVGGSP